MNCKNCGAMLNGGNVCMNCGCPVTDTINPSLPQVPQGMGVSNDVNNNTPSIGFGNYGVSEEEAQYGVGLAPKVDLVSNISSDANSCNSNSNDEGGTKVSPKSSFDAIIAADNKSKFKMPWIIIFLVLIVIMVSGTFLLPVVNRSFTKVFETDDYELKYNANWTAAEDKKMTLIYSDSTSKFMFNSVDSYVSLQFEVKTDEAKKILYDTFYSAWSNLQGGVLTGGTGTFIDLTDDTLYARVDYQLSDPNAANNVGAFYVLVSEKYNKVISFMSYCNKSNWDTVDKEIILMLNDIVYKSEDDVTYKSFEPGSTLPFTSNNYMSYSVPSCWALQTELTNQRQGSSVFRFSDDESLLEIKAMSIPGLTDEAMINSVSNTYGGIKTTDVIELGGKDWNYISTTNYNSGKLSYHNDIYYLYSRTGAHIYYIEVYVSNNSSPTKIKYIKDSIEYIVNSMEFFNYNQ